MPEPPESSPAMQRAQTFFQYGNEAALKNNFDYAIQMYQEACKLVPENLLFRQALRGIERRRFGNEPSKVGFLVGARNQPIRLRARAAKAKGQWAHALEVCEEAFVNNPWDVEAARIAAEAAEGLEAPALATWMLESVAAQAGDDADFLRHQAHAYELNEQWEKAIRCWERVRKLAPADEHAKRQINALTASATIQRSGLGEAIDRAGEPAGGLAAEAEELKKTATSLSPEERLLKEIEADPARVGPYLELADHLRRLNRLDEAEKLLARGLKALPDEAVLQTAHAEVQIARLQRAVDAHARKLKANPDDAAARARLEQLTGMLNDYELKEFRRRAAARPEDPRLHYELGLRLARVGRHDEAIAEFQQARSAPALKAQALHQAGLSFEAQGLWKLAERSLKDALAATDTDDQAARNALNYRLGRVAESMGNIEAAEEYYNEVAANDYAYQDVALRLRNLHQK